jgi:hypothetical protein
MRKILVAAALSLAAVSGCSKSNTAPGAEVEDNLPTMTVDELDRALATNQARPVDCNSDKTRKRAGVVPGAILVTDDESYAASELPADKTTKLVFYCANAG